MKQIGARQEAGRIGGIGACGRELCCSSWVSSFSSVTTGAARVQDLSLNPQKLAGQCSKLKCCLMYEYDVYADARRSMPRLREPLQTLEGEFFLVKTDVLARQMTFSSSKESWSNLVTISASRVREILAANRNGEKVDSLLGSDYEPEVEEPTYRTEEDSITRFDKAKKRKKKRNKSRGEGEKPQQMGEKHQSGVSQVDKSHNDEKPHSDKPQGGAPSEKPQGERQGGRHHNGKHRRHNHNNHHNHKPQE